MHSSGSPPCEVAACEVAECGECESQPSQVTEKHRSLTSLLLSPGGGGDNPAPHGRCGIFRSKSSVARIVLVVIVEPVWATVRHLCMCDPRPPNTPTAVSNTLLYAVPRGELRAVVCLYQWGPHSRIQRGKR